MKRVSFFLIGVFFTGCYVDHSEKGGIADIPWFLLDGGKANNSNSEIIEDQLIKITDADTIEFKNRTLELYNIKAPELNDEAVLQSQASQCTEADISVIEDMGTKSKEYISSKLKVSEYGKLDLKTNKDSYQKQIGSIYIINNGQKYTLGLDMVKAGYVVPNNYRSKDRLYDAKYQMTLQTAMADAIDNNRGLWQEYPAEMKCLSNIYQH